MLTYHRIDEIVADVMTSTPQPLRPEDLAVQDRQCLAATAARDGKSQEFVLAYSRRRLLNELAARQKAHRIALVARNGKPYVS